ncbi:MULTISPECIES: hypothetical protein [Burkholderia]|uniref:hypothetical protein n=1 Tax=Burkholderia TaxID=32008 RepID=UPI0015C5A586|nr:MULTISPECIES: hypothetical protein [Burkholderia]MBN3840136.1 hypothetical protein [Burkholderia sp. Ac-20349]
MMKIPVAGDEWLGLHDSTQPHRADTLPMLPITADDDVRRSRYRWSAIYAPMSSD